MKNFLANAADFARAAADELGRHLPGGPVHADVVPAAARRCNRGRRCAASERVTGPDGKPLTEPDGKPVLTGGPCLRDLCDTCERATAAALLAVPALYLDLENAMRPTTAPNGSGRITAKVTGSPMQINGRALHLQETVHQLLTVWEDAVRDTARLSPITRRDEDPWERTKRRPQAGRETVAAARLLTAHLSAWVVHRPIEYAITQSTADPEDPRAEPDMHSPIYITQAGWEAAAALIDWTHHVRAALGVINPPIRRGEPCMYCEVRSIIEINGSDEIRCDNCHRTWDRDEYAGKVRGFEPYLRSLAKRSKTQGA